MSLDLDVSTRIGDLDLAVSFSAADEVVAVLGPNGAGKTTLLRIIAGLVAVDSGRVVVDDTVLDDAAAGVFVPASARPVGMVFQDYLLFPFLSARENVAFPLRSRGTPKRAARSQADDWLARVGLPDRGDALPAELSGGQAQRVALARALVADPRVLLLDEPLAALDAQSRADIRRDLREHLRSAGGTRILVTHDVVDASVIADRIVILEAGRLVQHGAVAEVAAHPRSAYVADLVGLNLYRGRADHGDVVLAGGGVIVVADQELRGDVYVTVHPRAVGLHLDEPHGSARNHWRGTVVDVDALGDRVRVRIEGVVPIVAEVTRGAVHELALEPGHTVFAAVKATEVAVYPVKPVARIAVVVATAFVVALAVAAPVAAHGPTGTMGIEVTPGAAPLTANVRVLLEYTNDREVAPGATVRADATGPPGVAVIGTPLADRGQGVYEGTLTFPSAGSWLVTVTATEPAATAEATVTVSATSSPTSSPDRTTDPTGDVETSSDRADRGDGDDGSDGGGSSGLVVAALVFVVAASATTIIVVRRRR